MPVFPEASARSRIALSFRRPFVLESVIFLVGLAAVTIGLSLLPSEGGTVGAYVGAVVAAVGVVLSRFWRWPALLLVVSATWIDAVLWQPLLPWTVSVFVVFLVVKKGTSAVGASVFVGAGVYLAQVYADAIGYVDTTAFVAIACTVAAASIGSALRNRERARFSDELRARDAVAAREKEVDRRIIEERLRIARDLHDVIGHEIAVVSMNLGVAQVNLPEEATEAHAALGSARTGVQGVLSETQRILGVLRVSDDEGTSADSLRPAPGMASLAALLDSYRAVGLAVEAHIVLEQIDVDPSVDTAVYRLIQEALTNAQRHGNGDAEVSLASVDGVLSLRVSNTIGQSSVEYSRRRGYGLVGMRERVASVGGNLQINNDGHIFSVTATIRVDGTAIQ